MSYYHIDTEIIASIEELPLISTNLRYISAFNLTIDNIYNAKTIGTGFDYDCRESIITSITRFLHPLNTLIQYSGKFYWTYLTIKIRNPYIVNLDETKKMELMKLLNLILGGHENIILNNEYPLIEFKWRGNYNNRVEPYKLSLALLIMNNWHNIIPKFTKEFHAKSSISFSSEELKIIINYLLNNYSTIFRRSESGSYSDAVFSSFGLYLITKGIYPQSYISNPNFMAYNGISRYIESEIKYYFIDFVTFINLYKIETSKLCDRGQNQPFSSWRDLINSRNMYIKKHEEFYFDENGLEYSEEGDNEDDNEDDYDDESEEDEPENVEW
jgi:hypothetical protein